MRWIPVFIKNKIFKILYNLNKQRKVNMNKQNIAPTKQTLAALMGLLLTTNGQAIVADAATCINGGNQYTLMNTIQTASDPPNFTLGGTCCTTGGTFAAGAADNCIEDCAGLNNAFCASGGTPSDITNKFVREMLIPSDATNCPGQLTQNVVLSAGSSAATSIKTKHAFVAEVPNALYSSWHCKYKLSADPSLVP